MSLWPQTPGWWLLLGGAVLVITYRIVKGVQRYWRKMLCSRSRKGYVTWESFQGISARYPLRQPKLRLPYREFQLLAVL